MQTSPHDSDADFLYLDSIAELSRLTRFANTITNHDLIQRGWSGLLLSIMDHMSGIPFHEEGADYEIRGFYAPGFIKDFFTDFLKTMRDPAAFFQRNKLTPWAMLHDLTRRRQGPQGYVQNSRLDSIVGVTIEQMVGVMGLENCDFDTADQGLTPLHHTIKYDWPTSMAQLCRCGKAQLDPTSPIIMYDIANASEEVIRMLGFCTGLRTPYLLANQRIPGGGGTALHAVCASTRFSAKSLRDCANTLIRIGVDPTVLNDACVSPRALLEARPWDVDQANISWLIEHMKRGENPEKSWRFVREAFRLHHLPRELQLHVGRRFFVAQTFPLLEGK